MKFQIPARDRQSVEQKRCRHQSCGKPFELLVLEKGHVQQLATKCFLCCLGYEPNLSTFSLFSRLLKIKINFEAFISGERRKVFFEGSF